MPQFVPFFHFHQLLFALLSLIFLVYTLSKYFLPNQLFNQVIKTYIIKLYAYKVKKGQTGSQKKNNKKQ